MAAFFRADVVNAIYERGIVPSCRSSDPEAAGAIVKACADGGGKVVAFHLEGAGAVSVLESLLTQVGSEDPGVIVGAAGVADLQTAAAAIDAGANFICGESFDASIARRCNQAKVHYLPLCVREGEIAAAEEAGVETVRVQAPDPAHSPSFIESLLAGRPWSRVMIAGEVLPHREAVAAWIRAGAACIGMEAAAIAPDGSPHTLTAAMNELLWNVKEARGEKLFCGVEHLGIYPEKGQPAAELTDWYSRMFEFEIDEGPAWYFARSSGPGRIEILKDHEPVKAHVAIKVRHFELGCRLLEEKGIEFEPVKDFGRIKAVFLKQRDPAGHKVHLIYQALL